MFRELVHSTRVGLNVVTLVHSEPTPDSQIQAQTQALARKGARVTVRIGLTCPILFSRRSRLYIENANRHIATPHSPK